jgi:hypothetical protein
MKLKLKIDHQDQGELELVTRPADMMKWERLSSRKLTDLAVKKGDEIQVSIGIEDLMIMAYAVISRSGQTEKKFDAWADGLESIELMEIDEVNPPQSGA